MSTTRPAAILPAILGVNHTAVDFAVPAGACDCHTHVFGPGTTFPYWHGRVYTPGDASISDLNALHRALTIDRVVIVHPSPYGPDNACSADAIAGMAPRARGVAVIDPAVITDAELTALHQAGFRGARANLQTAGVSDPAAAWATLQTTAARVAPLGWHLQTYTNLATIAALADRLQTLPVPLVVDHFGHATAALGVKQLGFAELVALVGSGKSYVKISGSYRISNDAARADVPAFARALIDANSERVLWGTDWPHPGGGVRGTLAREQIEPFIPEDDGAALNRLNQWTRNRTELTRILVDNPARLYGF
jgi:predicted TIM-barrel fold metal-dependent hydrolase